MPVQCMTQKLKQWRGEIEGENVFLSIVQAAMEVLKESHFSLQMGNCPIPVAEDSGLSTFDRGCVP